VALDQCYVLEERFERLYDQAVATKNLITGLVARNKREIGAISRGSPRAMLWDRTIWGKRAVRKGKKEFNQFLQISLGSLSELGTQVLISRRLGYLNQEDMRMCKWQRFANCCWT